MKPQTTNQLDLLASSADAPNDGREDKHVRLAIAVDQRRWLRFLTEEWLFPDADGRLILGVDRPTGSSPEQGLMTVGIWFDPAKLPTVEILAQQGGNWATRPLTSLDGADAIVWAGPLPLFAVERFTIDDENTRAHLMAMARNFADMELPSQPIAIEPVRAIAVLAPPSAGTAQGLAVTDWDGRRGAASMALWALPAIGPWLDVLRDWLRESDASMAAEAVNAPWLVVPPWAAGAKTQVETPKLWQAMLEEFSRPGLVKEWRPGDILEGIAGRARSLGEDGARVDRLVSATTSLLQDRGTIEQFGLHDDVLALALQLLLLRPLPERFLKWRDDWPGVSPGSWWTGAILSGYLCGFRAMPLQQRGGAYARKLLALRTWHASAPDKADAWDALIPDPVDWCFDQDAIVIRSGDQVLAELKPSTRGRWHAADLRERITRQAAETLAREHCSDCMLNTLLLTEGKFALSGDGNIEVDHQKKTLRVNGCVSVALSAASRIESRLDETAFRIWLATAGIPQRLPKPPAVSSQPGARAPAAEPLQPNGLKLVKDFISPDGETSLLASIDASEWSTSMSRRVQHHGWRYDYKAKKVDPSGYLGPLPHWALALAHRLHDSGLVPELPDQVIVNEYVGAQGIAKHIDCPSCFRGPIVTISLIESWEMVFSRKSEHAGAQKVEVLLHRRSAAILAGEAREIWQHEIPRKKGRPPRGRRVSITFRKVDI